MMVDPNRPSGITLQRSKDLTAQQLLQAAALIRSAMPQFYETLPHDRADAIIAKQLLEPDNELSECQINVTDELVTGVFCAYPCEEQIDRQSKGLHQFAGSLERGELSTFFAHLKSMREHTATVNSGGCYLARLAVHEDSRGSSLAGVLLETLIDEAGDAGISLHVRSDNVRAINFYRRNGFEFVDSGSQNYRVMERH